MKWQSFDCCACALLYGAAASRPQSTTHGSVPQKPFTKSAQLLLRPKNSEFQKHFSVKYAGKIIYTLNDRINVETWEKALKHKHVT